jgi:hypothetical protein
VQFFNRLGESQFVSAGNGSQTDGDNPPSTSEDDRAGGALVSTDTSDDGEGGGGDSAPVSTTGRLTIVIQ